MKRQVHSQWHKPRMLKMALVLLLFIGQLFLTRRIIQLNDRNTHQDNMNTNPSFRISYTPPQNATKNQLLTTFEKVMSLPGDGEPGFVPWHWHEHEHEVAGIALIIEDGKILCRGSHYEAISKTRARSYIQMLNRGEQQMHQQLTGSGSLPVMLVDGDLSGCDNSQKIDHINFPRLTWHTPAPKHGTEWCQAIGMVGYEMWNPFQKMHAYYNDASSWFHRKSNKHTWDKYFKRDERKYPWSKKINKAVWRGSTTGKYYPTFESLPRAQLVKKGMERQDLFDVGFSSFVQSHANKSEELLGSNRTKAAERIPVVDQMKFRAIIDIDGNTWSSRFAMLLCTNSVIIKIEPDWIEYFYTDLQPMVHYVPASIENITEVTEYVVDEKNMHAMKSIVDSANSWCKRTNTQEQLPKDAVSQLKRYESAVIANNTHWADEWKHVRSRIWSNIGDDLRECRF